MPHRKEKSYKKFFRTLGASNHTDHERQREDYYATEPKAVELLCELENFNTKILEPACGQGHISEVLKDKGYKVTSSDLIDRGYGNIRDFLSDDFRSWSGDIITNPPYKEAQRFIEKSLDIIPDGHKVAMFLKVLFLEGKERKKFFSRNPPRRVWVSSSRLKCAMNGDFANIGSSATAYAWFIWEKGYKGTTELRWFN